MAYAGTAVAYGRGKAVITATGMETSFAFSPRDLLAVRGVYLALGIGIKAESQE